VTLAVPLVVPTVPARGQSGLQLVGWITPRDPFLFFCPRSLYPPPPGFRTEEKFTPSPGLSLLRPRPPDAVPSVFFFTPPHSTRALAPRPFGPKIDGHLFPGFATGSVCLRGFFLGCFFFFPPFNPQLRSSFFFVPLPRHTKREFEGSPFSRVGALWPRCWFLDRPLVHVYGASILPSRVTSPGSARPPHVGHRSVF